MPGPTNIVILFGISSVPSFAKEGTNPVKNPESSFSTAVNASLGRVTLPSWRIFFAFLLLFQQLLLTGDVTAVALANTSLRMA